MQKKSPPELGIDSHSRHVDRSCQHIRRWPTQDHHLYIQAWPYHWIHRNTRSGYSTKRERRDTCMAITFLSMRVWAPDKDDWDKLLHIMQYIRGTRKVSMNISANGSGILKWWVYASFAVHTNMWGHSVGGLYLGRGFPIVISTKQNINTKRSTKTEIMGVDEFMPDICWTQYLNAALLNCSSCQFRQSILIR